MPRVFSGCHVLLDLIEEDDGVTDDHPAQRQDSQIGHESQRLAKEKHPQGYANESHRRRDQCQYHQRRAAELEHEQGHDDDNHDRHGNEQIVQ